MILEMFNSPIWHLVDEKESYVACMDLLVAMNWSKRFLKGK